MTPYLKGNTLSECETNVAATVKLFTDLSLTHNMAKSVLIASQFIYFSGLYIEHYPYDSISNTCKSHEVKIKSS